MFTNLKKPTSLIFIIQTLNLKITLEPLQEEIKNHSKMNKEERESIDQIVVKNQEIYNAVFEAKQRSECPANLSMKDLYSAIMQNFQPPADHDSNIISTEIDKQEQKSYLQGKVDLLIERKIITPSEKEELLQQFNKMFIVEEGPNEKPHMPFKI
jgi:hypothetical protein